MVVTWPLHGRCLAVTWPIHEPYLCQLEARAGAKRVAAAERLECSNPTPNLSPNRTPNLSPNPTPNLSPNPTPNLTPNLSPNPTPNPTPNLRIRRGLTRVLSLSTF